MLQAIARACIPILGDAVFVDACEDGVYSRRVASACLPRHEALGAAIDAQVNDRAWRDCVERVVMTASPLVDPLRVIACSTNIGATAMAIVPLAFAGRVHGVFGAVRVAESYSSAELELVTAMARRFARVMDEAQRKHRAVLR